MAITLRRFYCVTASSKIFVGISGLFCLLMVAFYTTHSSTLKSFSIGWQKHFHDFGSLNTRDYNSKQERIDVAVVNQPFDFPLPENDRQLVEKVLSDKYKNYLRPVTTIISNLPDISSRLRRLPEMIIQSGYGLQPYKTERGEDGWIENGIVYRPNRLKRTVEDLYIPEYESYVPFDEDLFFGGRVPDPSYKTEKKIILWHTPPWYVNPTAGLEALKACPEFPCLETTNRSHYSEQSAALVFGADKIHGNPPHRTSRKQIFVIHNHEPPAFYLQPKFRTSLWGSVFNWTFTYRVDSDIVVPYGIVRKRPKPVKNKDYRRIFAQKTGIVAWAVSHCSTRGKREKYAEELKKYIPVDIIGRCGTKNCTRDNRTICTDDIAQKYKFYLSFESVICPDYLTEKIFYYMAWDIVTVARGSNDYYLNIPSNIFINTNDFPSPRKLAERLWYLAKNETAYLDILRAKDKYMILLEDLPVYHYYEDGKTLHNDFQFHSAPVCLLCHRLWNLDRYSKTINNIMKWFQRRASKSPTDLNFH